MEDAGTAHAPVQAAAAVKNAPAAAAAARARGGHRGGALNAVAEVREVATASDEPASLSVEAVTVSNEPTTTSLLPVTRTCEPFTVLPQPEMVSSMPATLFVHTKSTATEATSPLRLAFMPPPPPTTSVLARVSWGGRQPGT